MKKLLLTATISLLLFSGVAQASTSGVSSPSVKKGQTTIEFRTSIVSDDNSPEDKKFRTRQSIQYGINETVAARIIFNQRKPNDDSWEHSDFDSELKFKLFDEKKDGFGGAFHIRYEMVDNDKGSDEIELRSMFRKYFDDIEFRNNTLLKHEVGANSNDGLNTELRWQIGKPIEKYDIKAGFELFNDFGNLRNLNGYDNQAHEFGPFISGEIVEGLSYHARGLFGVSKNADDFSAGFFIRKSF